MKKILVVEDEPAYLQILHDQLKKHGYEVIEAKDGEQGLALAKRVHPDLILLDIKLPLMNGITLLDELRTDDYGRTAKVIILTNIDPDDHILQRVMVDLPTYYLMKSTVQLDDLMTKIKELLTPSENPQK